MAYKPDKEKAVETLPEMSSQELLIFEKLALTKRVRKRPVVLIVEDQLFSRKLLFSSVMGVSEVYAAENALEGWERFMEVYPDIAFLDIDLQGAVTGHMLARKIKKTAPETFIAMVSANHSEDEVALAKSNRVDAFVVKPFSKQKIMQCLAKHARIKEAIYKTS